jgi:hypothetical protein
MSRPSCPRLWWVPAPLNPPYIYYIHPVHTYPSEPPARTLCKVLFSPRPIHDALSYRLSRYVLIYAPWREILRCDTTSRRAQSHPRIQYTARPRYSLIARVLPSKAVASGSHDISVRSPLSTTSKSVGAGTASIPDTRNSARALGMCRAEVTSKTCFRLCASNSCLV